MGKYLVYKRNSNEYNKIIDSFLDKAASTLQSYYSKEELKKLLSKNLKKIKKLKRGESFKYPFSSYCAGIYHPIFKTLTYTEYEDDTIEHELFHALSGHALLKRESILKIIAIVFLNQKQLITRNFEEGITEYLTGCINGKEYLNLGYTYDIEKHTINKLSKIYGQKTILDYYLGYNKQLEQLINKNNPRNFKMLNYFLNNTDGRIFDEFSGIKYDDKKGNEQEENLVYSLFENEKLISVSSIDDFKYNLHELFNFYEPDLYHLCSKIVESEYRLDTIKDDASKETFKPIYQKELQSSLQKFSKFNHIIRHYWKQLDIDDETLYNNLILDEIEQFDEEATTIIIDYLEYWNNDILSVYNKRTSSQEVKKTYESKPHQKKETLMNLKESLLNIQTNQATDYQENLPKHK